MGGAWGARAGTAEWVNILWLREGQTQHAAFGNSRCWQTKKSNKIKQIGINYTKVRDFFFGAFVIVEPHSLHFISIFSGHHIFSSRVENWLRNPALFWNGQQFAWRELFHIQFAFTMEPENGNWGSRSCFNQPFSPIALFYTPHFILQYIAWKIIGRENGFEIDVPSKGGISVIWLPTILVSTRKNCSDKRNMGRLEKR